MPGERIGNSNQYLTISGVVSAPAYSWASDNDTGLYRIGANNIGIAANGTKVLDIATTAVTITPATTLSAALTYGGVTLSNAVTGTGNMVLSASPTFTGTVAVAAVTATSLALGGATLGSNALAVTGTTQLNSALNYGGVTLSNAVTGTGNMVLSASPTLTGTLTAAAANFSGTVAVTGGNLNVGNVLGSGVASFYKDNTPSYVAGVGTVVPGGSAASALIFSDYQGSWVERMRLDASGRLGIGMTPVNVLDITQNQNSESRASILNNSSGAAAYCSMTVNNGTSSGTLIQFGTGNTIGGMVRANGTYLAGRGAGGLTLVTEAAQPIYFGIGGTEYMRLGTNGYLGIGRTPTTYPLEVKGTNGLGIYYTDGTITNGIFGYNGVTILGSISNHPLTFIVNNAEKARFDASGNLGIGMTPVNILDITQSVNGQSLGSILNSNAGVNANAKWFATNGTNWGTVGVLGQSFTTTGAYVAGYGFAAGNTGMSIIAQGGPILFASNGTTEVARFDTSGQLGIGMTPSQVLDITKNHNNFSAVQITNSNVGASAYSGYQINNGSITGGIILSGSGNAGPNTVVVYANSGGSVSIQPSGGSGITQFYSNGAESARISAAGSLLVGTTSSWTGCAAEFRAAGNALSAYNTASAGTAFVSRVNNTAAKLATWNYNGSDVGTVTTDGTTTAYNTSSDARLKTNVSDAAPASSLIDAIQVRQFDWKVDNSHQRYGMVAQELLEVAPEAVSVPADPEQMMGVDYSKLVPMLIKEVQSLRTRLAALENK